MNLEDDLKRVLRPQSPPAGFAARVMERIDDERAPKRKWWRAVAASLTLTALLGASGAYIIETEKRRQGERAKEQVLLALRIAGEKVRIAQDEVRGIGSPDE